MTEKMWHVLCEGKQIGPFSRQDLLSAIASGKFHGELLVWRDGFSMWQKIEDTELAPARPSSEASSAENGSNKIDLMERKIPNGWLIFFVPIVFAWFTLGKGNSNLIRAASFGWLFIWLSVALGELSPKTEPVASAPRKEDFPSRYTCSVGIFAGDVEVTDGVARKRLILNPLSSADLFAGQILEEAWNVATACPGVVTLQVIVVERDLVDRYGNDVPDRETPIQVELEEARKFKDIFRYSQDDLLRAGMAARLRIAFAANAFPE